MYVKYLIMNVHDMLIHKVIKPNTFHMVPIFNTQNALLIVKFPFVTIFAAFDDAHPLMKFIETFFLHALFRVVEKI